MFQSGVQVTAKWLKWWASNPLGSQSGIHCGPHISAPLLHRNQSAVLVHIRRGDGKIGNPHSTRDIKGKYTHPFLTSPQILVHFPLCWAALAKATFTHSLKAFYHHSQLSATSFLLSFPWSPCGLFNFPKSKATLKAKYACLNLGEVKEEQFEEHFSCLLDHHPCIPPASGLNSSFSNLWFLERMLDGQSRSRVGMTMFFLAPGQIAVPSPPEFFISIAACLILWMDLLPTWIALWGWVVAGRG